MDLENDPGPRKLEYRDKQMSKKKPKIQQSYLSVCGRMWMLLSLLQISERKS